MFPERRVRQMNVINWIRLLLGAVCIAGGLIFDVIQLIGVFRYRYVMNRIHAAAIGDTLGGGLVLLGVFFMNGFNLAGLKILFITAFLWLTSPVAAHMVGKLEVLSKKYPEECCPVRELSGKDSIEEASLGKSISGAEEGKEEKAWQLS